MEIKDIITRNGVEREINLHIGSIESHEQIFGGSNRVFYRIKGTKERSLILLYDKDSRALDRIVQISKYLNRIGNISFEIYQNFWEHHLLLMQDLGDISLEDYYKGNNGSIEKYNDVIEMLLLMQSSIYRSDAPVIVKKAVFGYERLLKETEQFMIHFIGEYLATETIDHKSLSAEFDRIALEIAEQPKVFMHRDFQSKNILLHDENLKVIDIQEGCIGPYTYDLAAVLFDPYIMLSRDEISRLSEKYFDDLLAFGFLDIDKNKFSQDLTFSSISRIMQAVGAFSRLTLKGKTEFEQYIAPGFSRLLSLVDFKMFPALSDLLKAISLDVLSKE